MNKDEITHQLQAAVQAYRQRDLHGAELIFNQILSVHPTEPNALHLLGCIHKDRGQLQHAVNLIQASIREDATNPIPFLNLGKVLASAGQHENAVSIFQESLKRNQQIPETWFCLGNALRYIEKIEEAKQAYRNVLQLNPAHAGASANLGPLLMDDGEFEEAERLFLTALDQTPNEVKLRINYGRLLSEKHDHAAAIVQYQIALPLVPESHELHYNFAKALRGIGEFDEAILSYRKTIELNPNFVDAYLNLGFLLKEEGRLDEAIANYSKAIELKPDFAIAYLNLGVALKDKGEVQEAIVCFRKGIELRPDVVDAYRYLGQIFLDKGDYLASIDYFKKALSLNDCHLNSAVLLGSSFLRLGDTEAAISYYSHRLSLKFCPISAYYLFRCVDRRIPEKINEDFDVASDFCATALRYMKIESVLAFGDSHVRVFSGIKGIEVNYVGASTAFNLLESNTASGGSRRIWSRLRKVKGDKARQAVMLCFGEIDCRNHVIRQCYLRRITIRESVSNVISKYLQFIRQLHDFGFKVIVYGCYGSGSHFNAFGSEVERNLAAYEFNQQLEQACSDASYPYFALNDLFVDEFGSTRKHLMYDDAHLPEIGNAGVEIRSILMERFLTSCKQTFSSCLSFVHDPLLTWKNNYCNFAIADLGLSSQHIADWNIDGVLLLKHNMISNLWLDLGSTLELRSLSFQFKDKLISSCDLESPFCFLLDGIEVDVLNLTCVSGMLRVDVERRLSRYVQIIPSISSSVNLGDVVRILPNVAFAS